MGINPLLWTLFPLFLDFTLLYLVILRTVNSQYIAFVPIY